MLPYCPLPGHHRAFSWTPSDNTNIADTIARFLKEHTADDLVPKHAPHAYGDDFDAVERSSHLDLMGEFQK
jgi:hypothetical protein